MRGNSIQGLKEAARSVARRFDTFLKYLGSLEASTGGAFDISKSIPRTDSSISDILARISSVVALTEKMDGKGAFLVPRAYLTSFVASANALTASIEQIEANITNHISSHGGLNSIDYSTFQFVMSNGTVVETAGDFKQVFDACESLLTSFQQCFQTVNPSRASFNFSAAATTLSNQISANSAELQKLKVMLKKAEESLGKISGASNEIGGINEKARQIQEALDTLNQSASAAVSQIEGHKTESETVIESARTLRVDVESYQKDFDEFVKRLAARNKEFQSGSQDLDRLLSRFSEQEKTFDTLIEKSNQMLSSATVAGLASEFGTIRESLSVELRDAHKAFKWSIAILIISALPLVIFIFSPLIAPFVSDDARVVGAIAGVGERDTGLHYIGQVIARFAILVPAAWYVAFCASRYNSLFRLREHYAYKYSMAVSVEGFKKQAPGYEEMIAALVLEQLAFNPVDKLSRQRDMHDSKPPHPILRLLIDKMEASLTRAGGGDRSV